MGHARALLGLERAAAIERAARTVVDKGLSVRATEALVKKARRAATRPKPPPPAAGKSASVRDLEERLTRALGGPVTITEDAPGKAGTHRDSLHAISITSSACSIVLSADA